MTGRKWTVLDRILGEPGIEAFFQCYEHRPMVFRKAADWPFDDLFSFDDLETYLMSARPGPDGLVIADGDTVVRAFGGPVDPEDAVKAFRGGKTLVLNGVHERWPPLLRFSQALNTDLCLRTQINAYATPQGTQGFPLHCDDHDVLALQIAGRKTWKIWQQPVDLPLPNQHPEVPSTLDSRNPDQVATLEPGDVVYLPRGAFHAAEAQAEPSLHLSVGLFPVLWLDVLQAGFRRLAQSERGLRESLPFDVRLGQSSEAELGAAITDLLAEHGPKLAQLIDPELVSQLASPGGSQPPSPLRLTDHDPEITLETVLERDPRAVAVAPDEEGVRVTGQSGEFRVPANMEQAITAILGFDTFQPRDLPEVYTDNAKVILCKTMFLHGMLRLGEET